MKRTLTILSIALVALMLSSCVESSKKYQALQKENEALAAQNASIQKDFDATMGIINDVENNLKAIRDLEQLLTVQQEGSKRDEINASFIEIKNKIEADQARLQQLDEELAKQNKDNANLRALVKQLRSQLKEKEEMIANLQAQIAEKDGQIANLNTQVNNLNNDLNNANNQIENLNNNLTNSTNELNAVYYIGAKAKELKEKGVILSKTKVLKGEVPTEVFTRGDMRELTSITFNTKKALVLSTHATESYNLVKGTDANGNKIVTLEITNPELFWKVTRYLVVLTK
jgi:DNA repair exonuclease SbcCD ATPase subunit